MHLEAAGAGVHVSLRSRQLSGPLLRRRFPRLDRLRGLLHLRGGRALQLPLLKPRVSHVNALEASERHQHLACSTCNMMPYSVP